MYEENIPALQKIIETDGVIRNIAYHRLPDGTLDIDGNKKIWNNALSNFIVTPLWEKGAPGFDDRDPLQTEPSIIFVPAPDGAANPPKGTVIVAHGGGFEIRTGCEGMNVAWYFHQAGFNTAILTYRIKPYTRFDAIADMQRAIRLLRAKKEELHISDKVAVMGFSAGGMLSGNCATHYDLGNPEAEDPIERFSCRPDACVVGYGAFSMTAFPGPLFGPKPSKEQLEENVYLSIERNLTPDTPPFFIWQTNEDDPRIGMTLAWELQCTGVPFELHCFPKGAHGLALADGHNDLATKIPHLMHWAELCAEWLRDQGV